MLDSAVGLYNLVHPLFLELVIALKNLTSFIAHIYVGLIICKLTEFDSHDQNTDSDDEKIIKASR